MGKMVKETLNQLVEAVDSDPHDIESIANGIYRSNKDQKLRKNLVKLGRIGVKRFEWDSLLYEYKKLYHELIN